MTLKRRGEGRSGCFFPLLLKLQIEDDDVVLSASAAIFPVVWKGIPSLTLSGVTEWCLVAVRRDNESETFLFCEGLAIS